MVVPREVAVAVVAQTSGCTTSLVWTTGGRSSQRASNVKWWIATDACDASRTFFLRAPLSLLVRVVLVLQRPPSSQSRHIDHAYPSPRGSLGPAQLRFRRGEGQYASGRKADASRPRINWTIGLTLHTVVLRDRHCQPAQHQGRYPQVLSRARKAHILRDRRRVRRLSPSRKDIHQLIRLHLAQAKESRRKSMLSNLTFSSPSTLRCERHVKCHTTFA